jgi:1-acyl-sn-glycerol-3-phosphate acyltransferase
MAEAGAWLRSLLFTGYMFLSTIPYSLVLLGVGLFSYPAAYRVACAWVASVVWCAEKLCGLSYRVEGREHLPERASVVLLKHSSAYETLVEFLIFPRQSWVLKRELIWAPFLGWALARLRPIAINRKAARTAVEQIIRQGSDRLREGIWVMIFPEGTRMPVGQTRRYGVSGAALAAANSLPVIPVAHNAGAYWPRRGLRKRPGTVIFSIGPPIPTAGRDLREVNRAAQAWIESAVAAMPGTGVTAYK